ncbi:MAG: hypothetical protein ACOH10_07800 [Rhodoglobus sp.]
MTKTNATVTVTYNGKSVVVTLEGTELSSTKVVGGPVHYYLTNASRDYIATEVEKALIALSTEEET